MPRVPRQRERVRLMVRSAFTTLGSADHARRVPRAFIAYRLQSYCSTVVYRDGIVAKELTWALKCPGAMRRDFTRHRVKGPKFSSATRRNPANLRAGRPKTAFPAPLRGQGAHMGAMLQNRFYSSSTRNTIKMSNTKHTKKRKKSYT